MKPSTTGGTPIRVLILEDNPSDAELMSDALRQEGYAPRYERVEDESGFIASLSKELDLILSDYSLPQFDGIAAVKLARARGFHIPFVLVSGNIGEDIAVEAMRNGADDYLLKDRMARLGQAVRQAIEKRKMQEARLAAEQALARLNRVRAVLSGINSAIVRIHDQQHLLEEACRIAVEHGKFGIAWAGRYDAENQQVVPVASAGLDSEQHMLYTSTTVQENGSWQQHLVAQTISERRPHYSNDITTDGYTGGKRREEAIRRGYRSVIVLPLVVDEAIGGVFCVFAKEPGFFDDEEVKLLDELAGNISFALEHMARQQQINTLSLRLMEIEDLERRSFSRELHDRIGPNLVALSFDIRLIGSKLSPRILKTVDAQIADANSTLTATISQVRDLMGELSPPGLVDFGLTAALQSYAEPYAVRLGIMVSVTGEDFTPRPRPVVETALFRIAQEALNNIAKHAQARHVAVSVAASENQITLVISDDGVGFDTNLPGHRRAHWGLTTMRERAKTIGATIWIESAPGRGTRITVEVARTTAP